MMQPCLICLHVISLVVHCTHVALTPNGKMSSTEIFFTRKDGLRPAA